jgi:hypothetical protein
MTDGKRGGPPRWVFTTVMVGGFVACGLYIGIMRVEGASAGHLIRAIGFGVLGFLMLWGVLARR